MAQIFKQPLFWVWSLVALWTIHVGVTLYLGRFQGTAISFVGLLAALLILSALMSRRRKNLFPNDKHDAGSAQPHA